MRAAIERREVLQRGSRSCRSVVDTGSLGFRISAIYRDNIWQNVPHASVEIRVGFV